MLFWGKFLARELYWENFKVMKNTLRWLYLYKVHTKRQLILMIYYTAGKYSGKCTRLWSRRFKSRQGPMNFVLTKAPDQSPLTIRIIINASFWGTPALNNITDSSRNAIKHSPYPHFTSHSPLLKLWCL